MSEIEKYSSGVNLPAGLPPNRTQFLAEFTPGRCLRVFHRQNTPALALKSDAPTLGSIRREYSEDFLVAYIAVWIVNLNDFVNALRKMTPAQIDETAVLITQEYPYLNLADLNLVFRRIKKGEFGQLFAEIDGMKILSWFGEYALERARTAAEISVSQARELLQELPRVSTSLQEHKNKNRQAIGLHILQQAQQSSVEQQ